MLDKFDANLDRHSRKKKKYLKIIGRETGIARPIGGDLPIRCIEISQTRGAVVEHWNQLTLLFVLSFV